MNLGVDVQALEQKYPCKITQKFFYRNSSGQLHPLDKSKTLLPIFEISWGSIPLRGHLEYNLPAATMTIFAPTQEIIEYHLFDDSLLLLPKLEIKDFEKLLAISDKEFSRFNAMQRGDLITQFARVANGG